MGNNDWKEWEKQKLWEQNVKKWTSRFKQAKGNRQQWQKVYHAYLQSSVWKEKRRQILKRANGVCEKCGARLLNPEVHHITYERVGGNEKPEDLMALCFSCHRKADRQRDVETSNRQADSYYRARLNGFATRKYGDIWWYEQDEEKVEKEFIMFLYEKYCEEYGLDFDPSIDPETDLDVIEFWNQVLNGYY